MIDKKFLRNYLLGCASEQVADSDEEAHYNFHCLYDDPTFYKHLREQFSEMMHDSTMPFAEKAAYYLDEPFRKQEEEEAKRRLEHVWFLAFDEPWKE